MTDKIEKRNNWHFSIDPLTMDKDTLINDYVIYMLDRTMAMFDYKGLPNTITKRFLEWKTQTKNHVALIHLPKGINALGEEYPDGVYAFEGGLGGLIDNDGLPTDCIITSPFMPSANGTYRIGKDCVIIRNDSYYIGLLPLLTRYANLLAENDISLKFASINSRVTSIIYADNDTAKADGETFLRDIEEGKKLGIIGSKAFFEGVKTEPYNNSSRTPIIDLIELEQYLKGSLYMELGINSNYNMKREALNSNETSMNEGTLLPLIQDMLINRQKGWEDANKLFGLNVKVSLSPLWEKTMDDVTSDDASDDVVDDKEEE